MAIGRTSVMLSAMNNNEYYNGLTLNKSKPVSIYSQNIFWKNEITIMGGTETNADSDDNIFVKIVINTETERITTSYCSKCQNKGALCRHGVALALSWIDSEKEKNAGRVTTDERLQFLMRHSSSSVPEDETIPYSHNISLTPILCELPDEMGYRVEFQIGSQKKYVLKDLVEFYGHMQQEELIEYGKQLTVLHQENSFSEDSIPFLHFIMNEVQQHLYQIEKTKANHFDRRYISLHAYNAETFFNHCGDHVMYNQGGTSFLVPIVQTDPQLELQFQNYTEEGFKMKLRGKYGLISSGYRMYLYYDEQIYHCSHTFSEKMRPFLEVITNTSDAAAEKKDIMIHKTDMKPFFGKILQSIEPYLHIEASSSLDLSSYRTPKLHAAFYFDRSESNGITLRCDFCYDQIIYHPFETAAASSDISDDTTNVIYRNFDQERHITNCITEYFVYNAHIGLFTIDDEDMLYDFLSVGYEPLAELGDVYASEAFQAIKVKPSMNVKVGVSLQGDLLDLKLDTEGISYREFAEILENYRLRKKYYRMQSGEFLSLWDGEENTSFLPIIDLLDGLGIKDTDLRKGHMQVRKNRAFYIQQLLTAYDDLKIETDNHFQTYMDEFQTRNLSARTLPTNLNGELKEYQVKGYQWLTTLHEYGLGGILADEMGLGKTVQIISLLLSEFNQNPSFTALIVCPASLVYNWKNEVERFAPDLKTAMIIGEAEERFHIIEQYQNYQILITSYDLLRRDIDSYADCHFSFEILDEAQYIKNQSTKSAHAAKQIHSRSRFALTGTPIENRLSELWSIFDFLMPGYLFSYNQFKQTLETPIVKEQDEACTQRIQKMIAPFVLRRRKKDVLTELPDKLEDVVYSPLQGEQKQLYQAVTARLLAQIKNSDEKSFSTQKLQVLTELLHLRQICCDPSLTYDNYSANSSKLDTCMELIRESIEGGHKLLLFSQFTSMLNRIAASLDKEHISWFMLTGSTAKEDRMQLVDRFQSDEENTKVFLISLKAGGTGLNLTAADVVIHYDPWWNLAVQNQATDRTHRIGQNNIVSVHKLIMKDTIEEKILHLQNAKYHLAESILDMDEISIGKLTKDELLELLS